MPLSLILWFWYFHDSAHGSFPRLTDIFQILFLKNGNQYVSFEPL